MSRVQQYDELLDAVKTRSSDVEKQDINAAYQRVLVLRIAFIVLIVVAICFAGFRQNAISCVVLVLVVITYVLFTTQNKKLQTSIRSLMLDKCDPSAAVDRLVVLSEHSSARTWSHNFFNVGNALFYAGRFSEARSVAYVIKNNKQNSTDSFFAEMLGCRLCAEAGDLDSLERHVATMRTLSKDIKNSSPELRFLYSEAMSLPRYAYMELDHAYQTMYNELLEDERGATMLRKVEKAYRLVGLASKLGLREKEQEYRQFVLENGGTTYFKRELAGSASADEQLPLFNEPEVTKREVVRTDGSPASAAQAVVEEADSVPEEASAPAMEDEVSEIAASETVEEEPVDSVEACVETEGAHS